MSEVRIACAMADRTAGQEMVRALRGLGFKAELAPLSASRAAAQTAPSVLIWSRRAAAEPRLRALLRKGPAPLVARLDDAPAPAQTSAAIIEWDGRRAPAKLAALLAPSSAGVLAPTAAAPAPREPADLEPTRPAKGKAGGWIALAVFLALAAAAAGGAYYLGYFTP